MWHHNTGAGNLRIHNGHIVSRHLNRPQLLATSAICGAFSSHLCNFSNMLFLHLFSLRCGLEVDPMIPWMIVWLKTSILVFMQLHITSVLQMGFGHMYTTTEIRKIFFQKKDKDVEMKKHKNKTSFRTWNSIPIPTLHTVHYR